MRLAKYMESWTGRVDGWLANNIPGVTRDKVMTGRDAWTIAHRAGITAEAYQDRDVLDAHIQTALEHIFPAAQFHDAKRY